MKVMFNFNKGVEAAGLFCTSFLLFHAVKLDFVIITMGQSFSHLPSASQSASAPFALHVSALLLFCLSGSHSGYPLVPYSV